MAAVGGRRIDWWLVIGGAVLIICGIAIFAAPALFLEFLAIWAGIGFLISGAFGVVSYFHVRGLKNSAGWHLFMAVLDFVVGIVLITYPLVFEGFLPWIIGVAFIVFGAVEIGGLMPFSRIQPEARIVSGVSGVLSVLVGVLFIIWPTSLSLWLAAFVLVRGITLVSVGFIPR